MDVNKCGKMVSVWGLVDRHYQAITEDYIYENFLDAGYIQEIRF